MSMALASLASCYDMDDMSKNPYELPDNTTGGGEEQPGEEDKPSMPTSTLTTR